MAPVVLVALVTIGFAVLLAVLLPGAGLVGAVLVLAGGIAVIVWLLMSAGAGKRPSEAIEQTESPTHLGPGGPDDPR